MIQGCLLALLIVAMWMDIHTGRISNRLIGLGLLVGYIRNLVEYGWRGSFHFLVKFFFPVLMFYLLFLMHVLGAGDIKLFSVISCCLGASQFIWVMVYSFVFGALLSIIVMIYNRNFFQRIAYFFGYVKLAMDTGKIERYDYKSDGKQNYIHFSTAILLGFICNIVL